MIRWHKRNHREDHSCQVLKEGFSLVSQYVGAFARLFVLGVNGESKVLFYLNKQSGLTGRLFKHLGVRFEGFKMPEVRQGKTS